jgi:hypothetical protein
MKDKYQEAKALAQRVDQSINLLDNHVNRTVNECLRSKLIQEINQKSRHILETAFQKHIQLSLDLLEKGEEIIIKAIRVKSKDETAYLFDAVSKSDLEQHRNVDRNILRSLTVQEFRNKAKQLTNSILNGERAVLLGLSADEMLWDMM